MSIVLWNGQDIPEEVRDQMRRSCASYPAGGTFSNPWTTYST